MTQEHHEQDDSKAEVSAGTVRCGRGREPGLAAIYRHIDQVGEEDQSQPGWDNL